MLPLLLTVVFFLLCFIVFGKIYFYIHIDTDKRFFDLFIKVLGIKIKLPIAPKTKNQNSESKKHKKLNILTYIKYINFKKLYVNITLGTGDAAADALAVGSLQVIFGMLCSPIRKNTSPQTINVKITPDFENVVLNAKTESIISLKIRNIILQTIKNMRRN